MYDMYNTPESYPIKHITHEKTDITNNPEFIWKCCEIYNKRVKRTKQKTIAINYSMIYTGEINNEMNK
jgi:hypothetical protein